MASLPAVSTWDGDYWDKLRMAVLTRVDLFESDSSAFEWSAPSASIREFAPALGR